MAINAKIKTSFGEERDCYIRLNHVEASNHGVTSNALFRAFLSEEAFKSGAHYVAEFPVEFEADASGVIWEQAYAALIEQEGFDQEAKSTR